MIPPGEGRHGSPALPADVARPSMACPVRQSTARRFLFGLAHVVAADLLIVAMLVPGLAFLLGYWFAFSRGGLVGGASAMIASVPAGVVVYALYIAGLKKIVLSRIRPGTYPVLSLVYLRKWLSDGLMAATRAASPAGVHDALPAAAAPAARRQDRAARGDVDRVGVLARVDRH